MKNKINMDIPSELKISLNLEDVDFDTLLAYYFYINKEEGLVIRYSEEGYLFSAFTYSKASPLFARGTTKPNAHIVQSVNNRIFGELIIKEIGKLPDLLIQRKNNEYSVALDNVSLQGKEINELLFRLKMITKYGKIVDFFKLELDYDEEKEDFIQPYSGYQIYPEVGSLYDNYD